MKTILNAFAVRTILVVCAVSCCGGAPLVIDHRHTDITQLTLDQIVRAKSVLHIAYGHTSHGSQLTTGMTGLVHFANAGGKGLALPANTFAWNNGGTAGALDLHDYAMGGDVGYYPQWVQNTTNYLNNPANSDVNVIIWSWCGQMDDRFSAGTLSNEYLLPMTMLEERYPNVVFVYMTGHAEIGNDSNNKAACNAIREYCLANNKVLYDFNDIEHYDPDGTYYEFVNDDCAVYSSPGGVRTGNWATNWQGSHTLGVDWYNCSSAHSQPLNANQKAYAAWALWCAIAADLDRDGISDAWEESQGGCQLFGPGNSDFDGDGVFDHDEYVADTQATNANSRFELAISGNEPLQSISFLTSTSRIYSVNSSDDLLNGIWLPVEAMTNLVGTGDAMTFTNVDAGPLRYYRVGVSLP